ncbi:MAG: STAS domain-containing protein [Candidatus Sumerlaeia bacterium]|nr:STAS domain-containing protein [Candidatus Sumerlaeia bacterium]
MDNKIIVHEIVDTHLVGIRSEKFRTDLVKVLGLNPTLLVLDCTRVELLDSTCVGVLVLIRQLAAKNTQICLVGANQLLKRLHGMCKLNQLFPLYDLLEDALMTMAPVSVSGESMHADEDSHVPLFVRSPGRTGTLDD